MRSKTGCRGNPTSSGVNGLGGGSIRIQRATPHNHALRIIGLMLEYSPPFSQGSTVCCESTPRLSALKRANS